MKKMVWWVTYYNNIVSTPFNLIVYIYKHLLTNQWTRKPLPVVCCDIQIDNIVNIHTTPIYPDS